MVRISYHDLKFLEKIIKNNVFTAIIIFAAQTSFDLLFLKMINEFSC